MVETIVDGGAVRGTPVAHYPPLEAEVVEALPDARFKVRLENGQELLAYVSGKMRKFSPTLQFPNPLGATLMKSKSAKLAITLLQPPLS